LKRNACIISSLNDANLHNGGNPLTSLLSATPSFMGVMMEYQCACFEVNQRENGLLLLSQHFLMQASKVKRQLEKELPMNMLRL
jgi:hypothetical protein